jgi:hypothetical protein
MPKTNARVRGGSKLDRRINKETCFQPKAANQKASAIGALAFLSIFCA